MSRTFPAANLGNLTVARILLAAGDSFAESGYLEASINDVAARARVSKSLLRYHFESKDHILFVGFGPGAPVKEWTPSAFPPGVGMLRVQRMSCSHITASPGAVCVRVVASRATVCNATGCVATRVPSTPTVTDAGWFVARRLRRRSASRRLR